MQNKICVIGASNVDITGFTKEKLVYKDANIGSMKTSPGGVGRNIAENLHSLGLEVDFISVFGDDPLSQYIMNSCKDLELKITNSLFLKDAHAATFIAVMDENNDLAVGISAMNIYNDISKDFIVSKLSVIDKADFVVLETNMPEETLKTIVTELPNKKYILDTVSGKKTLKASSILQNLYILKTNLLEAQMLSNIEVNNDTDLEKIVQFFINKGVKNVFITLGENGVIYGNNNIIKKQEAIVSEVVNTIGAGDAFLSGVVYGDILNKDIHEVARYGMACAGINVRHDSAVSPDMKHKYILQMLETGIYF